MKDHLQDRLIKYSFNKMIILIIRMVSFNQIFNDIFKVQHMVSSEKKGKENKLLLKDYCDTLRKTN